LAQKSETWSLVVTREELGDPTLKLLSPTELEQLVVREEYQRGIQKTMVRQLTGVLNVGGVFPGLPTIANGSGPGAVLDGQQRIFSAVKARQPLWVVTYSVSPEVEAKIFLVLNDSKRVNPSVIVKAHSGPTAALVKAAGENGLPMNYVSGSRKNYSASLIAQCVANIVHPNAPGEWIGSVETQQLLQRADRHLKTISSRRSAARKVEEFTEILQRAFPIERPKGSKNKPSQPRTYPCVALAVVYRDAEGPMAENFYNRVRRWNWSKWGSGSSAVPNIYQQMKKMWEGRR